MPASIPIGTLEKFSTFGDLLRFLRRRAGLTQLQLAMAIGYGDAQISRLEQNQRPPDLVKLEACLVSALDLEDEPRAVARLLELAAHVRREEPPASGLCPYKGLNYFDESDADLFVGRDSLTTKLAERVLKLASVTTSGEGRFLAVVGASGCGKSSLVRAGLVPALRRNKESADWHIHILTPTAHPLESLAASLTHENASMATAATLMDNLARDPRSLQLFASRRLRSEGGSRLLLVIDQFEELLTLCRAEEERTAWIANLLAAAYAAEGPVVIVITLRADFYAPCANYPELRLALAEHQEYIGAMNSSELRRAIEEPARRGHWELEAGLVDLLLHDVGNEPGALPLLSHALLETWGRRRGRLLTLSGYTSSGGVRGAIAETAERVFTDQFTRDQQAIARRIFLRLTEPSDETPTADTRRRATFNELIMKPEEAAITRTVLKALADARLIMTGEDTAEVAHEALIREWPTLRGWLEENRQVLRLQHHLTEAAQEWSALEREPDLLYRGMRLAQARDWAHSHGDDMNVLEREFLNASTEQHDHEIKEREAQRQRELEAAHKLAATQQQANVQLRKRALYLADAFVIALIMALVALYFGDQARRTAIVAQNNARTAFARELAAESIGNLRVDPERSILLALQGADLTYAVDKTVLPEIAEALHRALQASRIRLTLQSPDQVEAVAFSPDGTRLASVSSDGTAIVWDAKIGREVFALPGQALEYHVLATQLLAFSPDGQRLAITAQNDVRILDASSGRPMRTISGHTDEVMAIAYSADGSRLATGSSDKTAKIWDASTGKLLLDLPAGRTNLVTGIEFSPDGTRIATVSDTRVVKVWDSATGQLLLSLQPASDPYVGNIAFSPDGKDLAVASGSETISIWDTSSGTLLHEYRPAGGPDIIALSPDGTEIATANFDGTIHLLDANTGSVLLRLPGHLNSISGLAFSPDGTRLASGGRDKTIKVWDLTPDHEQLTVSRPMDVNRVVFAPGGNELITGADITTVWDAYTGKAILSLPGPPSEIHALAVSKNGEFLAAGGLEGGTAAGIARIWDLKTGNLLLTLSGMQFVQGVTFNPDASHIAVGSFDGTTKVWSLARSAERAALTATLQLALLSPDGNPVFCVAYSPDGTQIASGNWNGTVTLWNAGTGRELRTISAHHGLVSSLAFSPDGKRLASASPDGTAKVWDVASGHALLVLAGHMGAVWSIAFNWDGTGVATGSGDKTAKIWDASTGKLMQTIGGPNGAIFDVAFSPDGTQLAVASADGTARTYLLRIDDLISLAKSRITRSLTAAECQEYLHAASCPAEP